MAVKMFAAISIGSAETEMRIYEISARKGMKEIDRLSTRINLGAEAYASHKLDVEKVEQLCEVLKDFKTVMEGYKVDAYEIRATSALREIRSSLITLDHIEKRTGLKIQIISNTEQRYLDYKSIASESASFEKIIQSGTAIVDIGGSSMQISVFDKDKLISTANIHMGKINTRDRYLYVARNNRHYETLVRELMEHELAGFLKLYQKDRLIRNLIVVDADLLDMIRAQQEMAQQMTGFQKTSGKKSTEDATKPGKKSAEAAKLAASGGALNESVQFPGEDVFQVSVDVFNETYEAILDLSNDKIASSYGISADAAQLVTQSLIFCRCLMEKLETEVLWIMDVSMCDGLCYDYAVRCKMIHTRHNFEEDIIATSRNIAKRYKCSNIHIKNMEELCLGIFDRLKKVHGMGDRERLLLRISAILHNCGKYISLTNVAECAYNIIMATDIIGLSLSEKQVIANVVKFNTAEFEYYDDLARVSNVTWEEYLVIAKLTAILRVANALDRSHKQKCHGAVFALKDDVLTISVNTSDDLTLEKVTLAEREEFFAEVFSVHPVIRQKKKM